MLTKASFHSHLGKGQMILTIIEVSVWRSLAEFQALAMRFTANLLYKALVERLIAVDRPKGQLIWKKKFRVNDFLQKMNERMQLYCYDTSG